MPGGVEDSLFVYFMGIRIAAGLLSVLVLFLPCVGAYLFRDFLVLLLLVEYAAPGQARCCGCLRCSCCDRKFGARCCCRVHFCMMLMYRSEVEERVGN